jgi:aldehyde dehydrogenase (NAD+)
MPKSTADILKELGVLEINESISTGRDWITSLGTEKKSIHSPINQELLGHVIFTSNSEYEHVVITAQKAFKYWRNVPAPKRGDFIRKYGNKLRLKKKSLAKLITLECGKSISEALGEVQEMIDICDFAVGLSRQLYGMTTHSERPNHRLYEQWHPLGIVGIISAFNFPMAVWSWNSIIAAVCGNVSIWKPSEKTPLSAVACMQIWKDLIIENDLPEGIMNLVQGDRVIGETMVKDKRVALISATGSTAMGKRVGQLLGARLGKSILELGGNNAAIVTPSADLSLALKAIAFGATGTAGQRCTSTRRAIIHESIYEDFKSKLLQIYQQLSVGNPFEEHNHIGPLIDKGAVKKYAQTISDAENEGGIVLFGGNVLVDGDLKNGHFVSPCIIEGSNCMEVVKEETFAPILYLMKYQTIQEAIEMQNDVCQGLSSSIFTLNIKEAELFLSQQGSDCGIANINVGTSGAEIGGAFGGEKETGGGRESGSDAWKAYMRRQTNTINYGDDMPLSQGIEFNL